MIVEAIYRNGQLELLEPLNLRSNGVRVQVLVPDNAIVSLEADALAGEDDPVLAQVPATVLAAADDMLAEFRQMLEAPPPASPDNAAEDEEQQERLAAIALRAEHRHEQGRPT